MRNLDLRFELVLSFGTRVDPDIRTACREAFGRKLPTPMEVRKSATWQPNVLTAGNTIWRLRSAM